MELDLTRLNNGLDKNMTFSFEKSFEKNDFPKEVIDMSNVMVEGNIFKDNIRGFVIKMNIEGVLVLPCAITLEPVSFPFNIFIDDEIHNLIENAENINNSLDIFPIVWENVLMEIPLRVVSENANSQTLNGDGWKLILEEEKKNLKLSALKDLI
jgi:uncharacterized protein